jgi:hypothetical protein
VFAYTAKAAGTRMGARSRETPFDDDVDACETVLLDVACVPNILTLFLLHTYHFTYSIQDYVLYNCTGLL